MKFGINVANLKHKAGDASIQSLHTAIYLDDNYVFSNGFLIGAGITLGGSTADNNKIYPLQGVQNLTSTPPVGGLSLLQQYDIYLGYAIIRRSKDIPLSIRVGFNLIDYQYSSGNNPAFAQVSNTYIPIELRGDYFISPTFAIEYMAAYNIVESPWVTIIYFPDDTRYDTKKVMAKSAYGFRLSIGGKYYIGNKTFFFANILAQYQHIGATDSAQITIPTPPAGATSTPGVLPGTSTLRYPGSSTTYIGLRFGVGF